MIIFKIPQNNDNRLQGGIILGPFGHFAVGALFGILIMLPYFKDRAIFDYDAQKWISIKWINYIRSENKNGTRKVVGKNNKMYTSASNELDPITFSPFARNMPIAALICGLFALLPDLSHLWGNTSLDRSRFADLFFFHYSIDSFFSENGFTAYQSFNFELPLFILVLALLIGLVAISQNLQYNRLGHENIVGNY